jgi:putative hemolysin
MFKIQHDIKEVLPITNSDQIISENQPPISTNSNSKDISGKPATIPKKTFILFPTVILLILVSLFAGYLLYQNHLLKNRINKLTPTSVEQVISPSNEPTCEPYVDSTTTNWETLYNKQCGYKIKYPKEFTLTTENPEYDPDPTRSTGAVIFESKTNKYKSSHVYIGCKARSQDIEVEASKIFNIFLTEEKTVAVSPPINKTINCFDAYQGILKSVYSINLKGKNYSGEKQYKATWLENEKTHYMIMITDDQIGNQILSTLSFAPQITEVQECISKTTCTNGTACMTNPAATFCECMGGNIITVNNSDGSKRTRCDIGYDYEDQWEYYRRFTSSPFPLPTN